MDASFALRTTFTTAAGTSFSRKRNITFPADPFIDYGTDAIQVIHYTIPMGTSATKVVGADAITANSFATIGASGMAYIFIVNRSTTQNLKVQLTGAVSKVGYVSLAPGRWFHVSGLATGNFSIDGEALVSIEGSFPVAGDEVEVWGFSISIES